MRGMAFFKLEKLDDAIEDFKFAIDYSSKITESRHERDDIDLARAHSQRGMCLRLKERFDEALADYDLAESLVEQHAASGNLAALDVITAVLINRGALHGLKRQFDKAEEDFEQSIQVIKKTFNMRDSNADLFRMASAWEIVLTLGVNQRAWRTRLRHIRNP